MFKLKLKITTDKTPSSCASCPLRSVKFKKINKKTVDYKECCIVIGDDIPNAGRCERCPLNINPTELQDSSESKDIVVLYDDL
jgi:hypothetical protein